MTNGVYSSFDYPGARSYRCLRHQRRRPDCRLFLRWFFSAIHGFLKTGEGYSSVDYPGAYQNESLQYQRVGPNCRAILSSSGNHGFLKTDAGYSSLDYPSEYYDTLYPNGINDLGQIVGYFEISLPPPPTPSPLPGSVLLLGSGLLGLMGWRRFR